ncbi:MULTISPECIES: LacI family DNA-binding transcriptional regulator [Sphingobium]|jgi:LacI family transcriptional regulator|uniref:LacI family transcriptional regulator n=2 Tax=Pseudomonadota TaxID=1224 RepID=A0A5J5I9F6_9SPHN|nr:MULTISPECIES: LacI family DNA-binding transcriptional regulator [Sphingobium]MBU0930677.1 LacI family DNA-binding transcriptional regulator [Alphaproteobacteria bacterium]KAA9020290.1 LacI family transcriptional regulator [Sphingobium limneticum]KAA9021230.1 LacI family transcriptional regulator [Sphingobium limneticum]KAA9033591.1 LacI family transcriptional regulator [Sphingobium limneticum]BBD03024.1 LacI family transcriptional regulator [Sphingobium sp. YG1]
MAKQKQDEGQAPKLTINDIARMAGVSKKTVSRVINRSPLLNRETRDRVETIIRDTGYVPNPQARALALGRNFLIGLVYDNPNVQMILSMQKGILEALHGTEFELVIRPVDRGSNLVMEDIRSFVTRQRLFGVVILPPMSENDALARMLDEEGCRYVRMGSAVLDDPEHMVASNDREAVADAVRHLIAQGHRRIGLIAGPHGFRSAQERREGFELALKEAGISLPRSLVADGQYTFESGLSASESLLDLSPRPTAIFASNDEMAAGVLYAARLRGIAVPEELSIIGFDDTPVTTRVWPPLTTVRWPIVAMGRAAALKLIGTAIGEDAEVNEPSMFSSTLIRRGSVAPPATS